MNYSVNILWITFPAVIRAHNHAPFLMFYQGMKNLHYGGMWHIIKKSGEKWIKVWNLK